MLFLIMRWIGVLIFVLALALAAAALALPPETLEKVVRLRPDWPMAQRGVDAQGAPRDPEGTGIAIFEGGYVATNAHVIGKATKVEAMLSDGTRVEAKIVAVDRDTDIALLKLGADLPVFEIAPKPAFAQPVCTIGNPFGLGLSVTCGVVSAPSRAGVGFNLIEDFVQTDAAVNPGASGGALVDQEGRLIGMLSAIFTKNSDSDIGVNFATSTKLLLRVAGDLREHGSVLSGDAGLILSRRPAFPGAVVAKVDPGGAAFASGIKVGDRIVAIDGERLESPAHVATRLFMTRPGETLKLTTWRGSDPLDATLTMR